MNFLKEIPGKESLLQRHQMKPTHTALKVNNHVHTPYSFSAFHSVQQAIQKALDEDVKILGINDFYVADGHAEFIAGCMAVGIFPLLNMEMIGVSASHQEKGIRINDPKNPGRIYVSGKGFDFPFHLPPEYDAVIEKIVSGSNEQVKQMISLLNMYMKEQDVNIELSAQEIIEKHAMKLLRERHVVRRLRMELDRIFDNEEYSKTLVTIFGGEDPQADRADIAATENELRSKLLKAGAPAFVPEDEDAFLPVQEIIKIIESAGGIPCYPMLLDGAGESMTEFERSKESLKEELDKYGFICVELIPLRNDIEVLIEYATYFYEQGFVVSFGTEHNTSELIPVTVAAKGGVDLGEELMQISYKGAAWQAAHQYLLAKEGRNYSRGSREVLETMGMALLSYYFDRYVPTI